MRRRGTARAVTVAAALAVGILAGCGGDAPAGEEGAGVPGPGAATDSAAVDSAAGDSVPRDDRPLRSRLLRLVNSRNAEVVVEAAAGAGWVSLDTIPPGDSSVVNVESRAPRVRLRAAGGAGPPAADSVDLEAPGTARWRIPAGTPPPAGDRGGDGAGGDDAGSDERVPGGQLPRSPRSSSTVSVTLK